MIWIETDRELGHVQIRLRHVEELNVLETNLKQADAVSIRVCVECRFPRALPEYGSKAFWANEEAGYKNRRLPHAFPPLLL